MNKYYYNEILKDLYLEDSFVLEIIELSDKLLFKMEFVLCESHQLYHDPKENERYCWHLGEIVFSNIESINWIERNPDKFSIDANNEIDYGNIDTFDFEENTYNLAGDWGLVEIKCMELLVYLF